MKKGILILALVTIGMLLMVVPANAAYFDIKTHGNFGTGGSEGCADCHTTHAADAAYLLASGPTETDACFACHGVAETASPYNVEIGIMSVDYNYTSATRTTWSNGNMYPSYAGGFVKSYDFKDIVDGSGSNDVVAGAGLADQTTGFAVSASAHNVEQPVNYGAIPGTAWAQNKKIPGGSQTIAGAGNVFKCGSCHDPHAGNAFANSRLLKKVPALDVSAIGLDLSTGVNLQTYRIDSYPSTINLWCAGCHDYFMAGDEAGHPGTVAFGTNNPNNKYRHPMGVTVLETAAGGMNTTISYGTPLSNDGGKLMCFSCHRAHGTAETVTAGGPADRFKRYNTDIAGTGGGSVLLRLKGRDTCYNCHGAATRNTYNMYHTNPAGVYAGAGAH